MVAPTPQLFQHWLREIFSSRPFTGFKWQATGVGEAAHGSGNIRRKD
jgi:hypothetical protein